MIDSAQHLLAHSARAAGRLRICRRLTAAIAFIFFSFAPNAYCDTVVSGSMDSVQLEARNSSVAEVLNALSQALPIRHRTSIELNHAVTGTFRGPALKVISRVLQDYDYVIRQNPDGGFEVMVIKLAGGDSSKVVSIGWRAFPYPSTEVNTGNPAVKGGPYPHPQWRARSYLRTMQPKTTP
jgi:hypothetical protein